MTTLEETIRVDEEGATLLHKQPRSTGIRRVVLGAAVVGNAGAATKMVVLADAEPSGVATVAVNVRVTSARTGSTTTVSWEAEKKVDGRMRSEGSEGSEKSMNDAECRAQNSGTPRAQDHLPWLPQSCFRPWGL